MKRKEPSTTGDLQRRRRQPQISCNSCRSKKLKCDRGSPCSSCVVRGLNCSSETRSQPAWLPSNAISNDDSSISSRLQSLERAVFGPQRGPAAHVEKRQNQTRTEEYATTSTQDTTSTMSSDLQRDIERQKTAKFLDSTYMKDDHRVLSRNRRVRFRIATSSSSASKYFGLLEDDAQCGEEHKGHPTWMMTRNEALALLQDFIDNSYHFLPVIYEPSTRSLIHKFYDQLEQGQAVDEACAALILSIAATSASFFNESSKRQHIFASAEEAEQYSINWAQSALNILSVYHSIVSGTLEESQARAIIAYVVYNAEGCSARFRFLHNCSVFTARDMSLHLIDSPAMKDGDCGMATKEIKRRLWWHLASNDWLLSHMNGPLDGTYTVHPRHMNVKYPRNLNDNDLSLGDDTLTFPLNVPTQMTCFLQRIRLAEICRSVADARDPGRPDVDITDPQKVSALDRLFEQALSDLPPFLQLNAPIPPGAPRHFALQRSLILLCFHVRRALLHRPFLLHNPDHPRHQLSRHQCISSARTAISISVPLLDGSYENNETVHPGGPLFYRLGIVISVMFMACTILALNAGLNASRGTANQRGTGAISASNTDSETQIQLSRACRALTIAGKKSVVAANLVRSLTKVPRRYRAKDIDDVAAPGGLRDDPYREVETRTHEGNNEVPVALTTEEFARPGNSVSVFDEFELDGLWDEFMNAVPNTEGFFELFADLDSLTGLA